MTYTVYIPNGSLFAQKQFASIKELLIWAMEESLRQEKAIVPVEQEQEKLTNDPRFDVSCLIDCKMEGADALRSAIEQMDWSAAAYAYLNMINRALFRYEKHTGQQYIREFEYNDIQKAFHTIDPLAASKEIMPEISPLIEKIKPHISELLQTAVFSPLKTSDDYMHYILVSKHPLTDIFLNIHRLINKRYIDNSWTYKTIGYDNLKDTSAIFAKVCNDYIHCGSDNLREFLLSNVLMCIYTNKNAKETIGSQESYEEIMSHKMSFLHNNIRDMIKNGLKYRHVQNAFDALGKHQVRRSEGNRYIGVALIEQQFSTLIPTYDLPAVTDFYSIGTEFDAAFSTTS